MTDERAAAVLRVLDAELPPSTVDIDRALKAGRRRERTRRGLAAGALAGVTVLAGIGTVAVLNNRGTAPPPRNDNVAAGPRSGSCTAAKLPGPAMRPDPASAPVALPTRISPDGRHIVGETTDPAVPVRWTDDAATELPVPAGVTAKPHAVNDAGVIVGLARRNDRTYPFVIRDGAYSELPLPAGAEGVAHAINARGDIAGEAMLANGDSKALLWKAAGGGVTTLTSTTKWAAAHAIGDDGTVFGSLGDGDTPYAWGPDGTGRAMPDAAKGKAMGVAGDFVFGHTGTTPTGGGDPNDKKSREMAEPRWVRWQLSTGAVVELTGLSPSAVDATGTVYGSMRTGGAPNVTTAPARWRDGTAAELPGGTGGVTAAAHDGTRLVGWTGDANTPSATVWTC